MARPRSTKLRIGERFRGEVRDLGSSGDGIVAHPNGQVFFVPGVWVGERGEFEISEFRGRGGFARLCSLEVTSPSRVAAPCPHHGFDAADCGGCPWMFIDYAQQLEAKQTRVRRALDRLDASAAERAIWASPQSLGYRNRAQLKTDGRNLGFVARGSRQLAPIEDCPVLNRANRDTLAALVAELPRSDWRPGRGKPWTTLDIDDGIDADAAVPNQRRPFRQGNSAQNERMQSWLRERLADYPPEGPVLELFAGSGNFTAVIADAVSTAITAVDSFAPAIGLLTRRDLPGVTTRTLDLHRAGAEKALARELADAELLVLDPPREGLRHSAAIVDRAPRLDTVLYVSCDLATFVRDCRAFLDAGFRLEELQPLDMFPHTPHIETLALLRR